MDSTIVLTYESKVKINGTAFGVRRGRIRLTSDDQETGDTESAEFKRQKPGRKQMEGELEFYQDTEVSLHTSPLDIDEDGEIDLRVYVNGLDDEPYVSEHFVLQSLELSGDINSPVSGTLSGKSDDVYYRPGDAGNPG